MKYQKIQHQQLDRVRRSPGLHQVELLQILLSGSHQAGIDAPGALQHIIIRGIERRAIFENSSDTFTRFERVSLKRIIPPIEMISRC